MISPELRARKSVCQVALWRPVRRAVDDDSLANLTDQELLELFADHPVSYIRLSADEALRLAYTGTANIPLPDGMVMQ